MRAGLIGYPYSGKTSLFEAVATAGKSGDVASVPVPDSRFERICEVIQPKKKTPATVEIVDNAARMPEAGQGKPGDFASAARKLDVLVHVARAFESDSVPFHATVNPLRDQDAVETELILADLQIVENRLERLTKSLDAKKPGSKDYAERILFEKVKPALENGESLRSLELDEEESEIIKNYQMLSAKPLVVAINISESMIGNKEMETQFREKGITAFSICAAVESEIAQMEPHDRLPFLNELGIQKPGSEALVAAIYDALGLVTFFTAGEKETKAWPMKRGGNAVKAAGTIHTDIAKGFIRAEVTHYADFDRLGNLKACYDQNLMKLEGKEYVVQDGDIINIRNKS